MRTEGQKQSRKHEDRLAARIGGSRTAASGAFWQSKGDVREERTSPDCAPLLIEHKWTGKKQFTLTAHVLEKVVTEALLEGRTPILGVSLNGKNYAILEEHDLLEMRDELVRLRQEATELGR